MKVMVIGKGGREHALVRALSLSPSVEAVWALPGNPGMEKATCVKASPSDHEAVLKECQSLSIDLVIIGPEDPLADGLADSLRENGMLVFGPDKRAAQLEASKIEAKLFMDRYNVPTASFKKVTSVDEVKSVVSQFTPPYVLKADGLAAGKGVFICKTEEELFRSAEDIFVKKTLGSSGDEAILEQFQPGYELSYFILTNGESYVSLPMAQDHKKLGENDEGPNTGGMGTVAPMKIDSELHQEIIKQVVEPTVMGLKEEDFSYRGVVFIGLMMTEKGPQVLEYNIRFGDPETQVLLPLLDGDWGEAFKAISQGSIPKLQWKDQAAACVVMAAENYPATPVKGAAIQGDPLAQTESSYFLHAGTDKKEDQWVTAGGRVMNAIGLGSDLKEALNNSYQQLEKANWSGMQFRKDIGKKATTR